MTPSIPAPKNGGSVDGWWKKWGVHMRDRRPRAIEPPPPGVFGTFPYDSPPPNHLHFYFFTKNRVYKYHGAFAIYVLFPTHCHKLSISHWNHCKQLWRMFVKHWTWPLIPYLVNLQFNSSWLCGRWTI